MCGLHTASVFSEIESPQNKTNFKMSTSNFLPSWSNTKKSLHSAGPAVSDTGSNCSCNHWAHLTCQVLSRPLFEDFLMWSSQQLYDLPLLLFPCYKWGGDWDFKVVGDFSKIPQPGRREDGDLKASILTPELINHFIVWYLNYIWVNYFTVLKRN